MFFSRKKISAEHLTSKVRYCLLYAVLVHCPFFVGAQARQAPHTLSLNSRLHVLEDKEGALSIRNITGTHTTEFRDNGNTVPGGGMSHSVFWIRIENDPQAFSSLPDELVLEIENPLADSVTLYTAGAGGNYSAINSGALVPFSEREVESANPAFLLSKADFNQPVFIRIRSTTIINFPVTLHGKESFYKDEQRSSVVYGIYFGIMVLFFIYSLLGFIRTKSRLFLFFCVFVVNVLCLIMSIKGLGFVYLWPDSILIIYYAPNFFTCFYVCMVIKFAMDILQVKKFAPAWHLPLMIIWYITITVFAASFFMNRYPITVLNNSYSQILLLVFIFLSFLTWKRGNKSGLYFSLGWICFLGFAIPFFLKNFGKLPSNFFTDNGPFIGSVFEVLFFSLAAATKVESLYVRRKHAEELFAKYESEVTLLNERIEKLLADSTSSGDKIVIRTEDVEDMIDNPLSRREREILELIVAGYINKEMADKLFVSENTIRKHIGSIYAKLGVNRRAAVSKKAIEMGLVQPKA